MSQSSGQANVHLDEVHRGEKPEPPGETAGPELSPADIQDGFAERETAPAAQPSSVIEAAPDLRETELRKLRAECEGLVDRMARLQAEFDNYRKRAARENAEFRDFAVADAARSLLPVADNFSLALKSAASPEEFKKGVELIYKQLQEALQKMNVQRISAEGQPFDPRLHEAIEMVESDQAEDNHVLEELQPGYRIKERLLRPAMVRVAKNTRP